MSSPSKRLTSYGFYAKALKPAIGGGIVFWATTIAISLLPIAAEYRDAFSKWSWNIQTVWVGSLFAGMFLGCCVSFSLFYFFDKIPTKNPILKSTILCLIALVIGILVIEVPRSFLGSSDGLYYLLIGILLNAPRFLFLGIAVGYLQPGSKA